MFESELWRVKCYNRDVAELHHVTVFIQINRQLSYENILSRNSNCTPGLRQQRRRHVGGRVIETPQQRSHSVSFPWSETLPPIVRQRLAADKTNVGRLKHAWCKRMRRRHKQCSSPEPATRYRLYRHRSRQQTMACLFQLS